MKKTLAAFIAALMVLTLTACGSSAPANTVLSTADAAGKEIGAVKGTPAVLDAEKYGDVHLYDTPEAMISELKVGIIDCAVYDSSLISKATSRQHGIKVLGELLTDAPVSMVTARENADLMRDINSALAAMTETGTLQKIVDSYFKGTSYSYSSPANVNRTKATLKLALQDGIEPYVFEDENGELTGIDVDVARAVSDILGVELTISTVPADELVTQVWYGKAEIAMGCLSYNEQDGEKVLFSDPYTQNKQAIIVRKK